MNRPEPHYYLLMQLVADADTDEANEADSFYVTVRRSTIEKARAALASAWKAAATEGSAE